VYGKSGNQYSESSFGFNEMKATIYIGIERESRAVMLHPQSPMQQRFIYDPPQRARNPFGGGSKVKKE
jgi:hypothetical protein